MRPDVKRGQPIEESTTVWDYEYRKEAHTLRSL